MKKQQEIKEEAVRKKTNILQREHTPFRNVVIIIVIVEMDNFDTNKTEK